MVELYFRSPIRLHGKVAWRSVVNFMPKSFSRLGKSRRHSLDKQNKQTPWSEPASELYIPSVRRLSVKLVPTFADRGCHVVSVADPYGRILGFLDRAATFSSK
jgi:CBS-domain-containing membrane protein